MNFSETSYVYFNEFYVVNKPQNGFISQKSGNFMYRKS